ncbi:unnamed protein product, partial [Allacma fusca]
PIVKIEIRRD